MNKFRYCQFQGHQENNTTYICTYKDCKLDSKWVCIDCSVQQIHNHGQPNQNHLMKQQEFLEFIKNQSQPMYSQQHEDRKLIQICIKGLQYFIQSTQFLMQRLQEDLATIKRNYDLEEIEEIVHITKNNHFLLENKQIEKIINLNNYNKKYEYNLSQDVLKQLINLHQDLQMVENNFKKQNVQIKQEIHLDNQIIQPNAQLVYKSHFENTQKSQIITSQISQDEKYLVFGGNDCKIQVYDIITKQLIKSIQIHTIVTICMFTKDSRYLICGDSEGYLICFDINNNFNQQYKSQIHSDWINYILPIDNNQIITCSSDQSIIITNIQQKTQQLLIKKAHNDYIQTIDYDQQNDVIISGSLDDSIKFFNRTNGKIQIQKYNSHYDCGVQYLQLISDNNNNLFSSGYSNFILWQIDYHKKQLNKIKLFNQEHKNLTSVDNNNKIILICDKVVQILDKNLNYVQLIDHNLDLKFYIRTRQLNSMNYIIVTNSDFQQSQIQVLKMNS